MRGMVHGKLALGSQICGFFALSLPLLCASCGSAPSAFPITPEGTDDFGNDAPTLTFRDPTDNITVSQGEPFLIRWDDSDSDDNAQIDFSIVNTISGNQILLAEDIDENDTVGPDSLVIATSLIPTGTYNLQGVIRDGVNAAVTVFAPVVGSGGTSRVVITIVRPGEGPQSVPPQVAVVQPRINLAVSQDDTLTIIVQPTLQAPDATRPYDQDSPVTLYILLDLDTDPTNDDPADPDPDEVIRLATSVVAEDNFAALTFEIPIDLSTIPPRPNGEPYFIRATAQDPTNPPVHRYADGSISVVRLASGLVDLFDMGRVLAGARFYGFSPGANLGSKAANVSDFDTDGLQDFVLVAQFGNPRNAGPVGEAYLIYGRDGERFGGALSVNTVSSSISGVVFEAPPVRSFIIPDPNPRTDGITDISFVPDLTGDGRPELLFGTPHVHAAFDGMDYDPEDADFANEDETIAIITTIRQGEVTVQEGDGGADITNPSYSGVDDTTIDSAQPTTNLGSAGALAWRDAGPGQRKWALIKFRNVLSAIPDDGSTIDITSVAAVLRLRVFNTGGNGTVHQCLTNFNEATTFQTFAAADGEPQPGVDFVEEELGPATAAEAGPVDIDVSEVVRQLIDGQLAEFNNEIRLIVIGTAVEGVDEAEARSSEYSNEPDRPILEVTYDRLSFESALGCYPDFLVNNLADQEDLDVQFTAGGMALMVTSENRDNDPGIANAPRLDTTSVALEMVGMEPGWILSATGFSATGNIFARADDGDELGRVRGTRFMAGPFDFDDAFGLRQPPRNDLFGYNVAAIGDLNNDNFSELLISAPRNLEYLAETLSTFGQGSTNFSSTTYFGNIVLISGADYSLDQWREESDGNNSLPTLDEQIFTPFGQCTLPSVARHTFHPADGLQVFPEDIFDQLGGASSAGDFNQDGIPDILCGAPLNNRPGSADTGATYILYGRQNLGDFLLDQAEDPILRAPMLRLRGSRRGDQIGWRQVSGLDVNGDRIDDVFVSSPRADFRGVQRFSCAQDFDSNGSVDAGDLRLIDFNDCRTARNVELFSTDLCKAFDYDNDNDVDADDRCVFCCLSGECEPEAECVFGLNGADCCAGLVDNGLAAVIFGGVFTDGDRDITQIATTDLPGVAFYGAAAGHRAGLDISTAGDFNKDGFGDILVVVPGEIRTDTAGRERVGVVYLIFGGTHLYNTVWSLASVGSVDLPGMVFLSPYVRGRPNEASPRTVAFIGDINNDGFGDIAIGNPLADFIDLSFPQGPNATDAELGRRRDAGDTYIVYGNNFGSNRGTRP